MVTRGDSAEGLMRTEAHSTRATEEAVHQSDVAAGVVDVVAVLLVVVSEPH